MVQTILMIMAGPYDYSINIPQPPAQNFLQSLLGIQQLKGLQQQGELAQQQAAIQQQNAAFQQQMQPLEMEKARAGIAAQRSALAGSEQSRRQNEILFRQGQENRVREMEQQAVAQAKQNELFGKLTSFSADTPMSDILPVVNELALFKPESAKQILQGFEMAPKQIQKATETTLVSAANQLKAGDIEGARNTYSTFAAAIQNSMGKNPEVKAIADAANVQAKLLDPQTGQAGINIAKASALELLGVFNPQALTSIAGSEKERAATEGQLLKNRIDQYEADNGISLADIAKNKNELFKLEAAERAHIESNPFVRKYIDSRTAFEMMKEAPQNASGDEVLLTQFVKMGDPGSVVSVTEKGGTRNVTLSDYVTSLYAKLKNDGSLGDTKRKELKDAAFKMLQAPQKQYKEYQGKLEPVYRKQGLNPENIFVLPSSEQILEEAKQQAAGSTGAINTGTMPVAPVSTEESRIRAMLRPAAGFGNTMTPSQIQPQGGTFQGTPSDVDAILKQYGPR